MAEHMERENNTLVNITNFGVNMTNERLKNMFEKYGAISSYGIMNDNEPWRRFAYVAFEDSDAADEAVIELNGQLIDDNRRLKVQRKRRNDKRSKPTSWSGKGVLIKSNQVAEMSNDVAGASNVDAKPSVDSLGWSEKHGFGVYVRNLDPKIDRNQLREVFEVFGQLRQVKIIMFQDNQIIRSKGFAFVTFAREDDARKAIAEMNGRLIGQQVVHLAISRGKKPVTAPPNPNRQRSFSCTSSSFDNDVDFLDLISQHDSFH